ncbi:MAG: DsrE family protein [Nitrospirae bacterium]|nr:DsrE family protein [Nitrospirota bacterium]
MATKKLAFVVRSLPYKTEASRLALTHAISSQTVEIYLNDGDLVEASISYVGDGVFNIMKNQQAGKHYGITTNEGHAKNTLLLDLRVLICKEDLDKFGLTGENLIMDADDLGGDMKANIVSYSEIQKEMETADHLLFC